MGLLDILKKRERQPEILPPIAFDKKVIESDDVEKDLLELASAHRMNVQELDFKILSYKTFHKKKDSPRYRELLESEKEKFFKEENMLNPDLEIMQKIKIEIFKRTRSNFPLKIAMQANKTLTQVAAIFKSQDAVSYFDGLEVEILAELDRKKAKQKILLGCFDEDARSEIKQLVSSIRVNKKIEENVTIMLCSAYEASSASVGEIKYLFKQKITGLADEKQRVDHANKGYMHTINEGDVMIEVLRAKPAKFGRNCRGEILKTEQIELSRELPNIKISSDIEAVEHEDKLLYVAKRSGFINEKAPNEFEIRDELVVNEVSFKTTGSISAGYDKEIKINIESKDAMSDAIGAGVHIETTEVKAAGNVGNGAIVKAKVIEIGGQVHQSAKLYGDDVKINLHKGTVDGGNITVELLEGGKIIGDIVHVKKASGGEIEAKEVYIGTVLSNVNVSASHHIELDKVEGTGNKFVIDAKAQRGFKEKVEAIERDITHAKSIMEHLTKKLRIIKNKIFAEKDTIIKIQEKIKELKESGIVPPSSLVTKMRENQARIKEHNVLLKEIKDAKITTETLSGNLENLQSSVFEAEVINHSTWRDFNEVLFKVINPPINASQLFRNGEIAHRISLKESEEGEFILVRKG